MATEYVTEQTFDALSLDDQISVVRNLAHEAMEDVPAIMTQMRTEYGDIMARALNNLTTIFDVMDGMKEAKAVPMTGKAMAVYEELLSEMGIKLETGPKEISDELQAMIDRVFAEAGLPKIADIAEQSGRLEQLAKDRDELQAALDTMKATGGVTTLEATGDAPEGKLVWKKAYDVFDVPTKARNSFAMDIPTWEWDGKHPDVPEVDPHYIYRPFLLMAVLKAIVLNERMYLQGHTGTGKTTLLEQVAARMQYPFMRVNFDSDITRMDLVGRDKLTASEQGASSEFVEGILPQMLSRPCIGCFDEVDFVRSDVGYVMQRAAEGKGLVLTEDGGRLVRPHPMFRMFATGNTVGQGDEHGMYQGARVQSMAFLDRFTSFQQVEYLTDDERMDLLKRTMPSLPMHHLKTISAYVAEHITAFTQAKIAQPISPRGYISLAKSVEFYLSYVPTEKKALRLAFEECVLNRASAEDRAVIEGIINRVLD